ncbi:MAG: hypothetical protein WBC33_08800 [Conexibacter sp.]
MAIDRARVPRGALAGGVAAAAWALQQPLDKRAFRSRYDDVELLGRMLAPHAGRRRWYPLGFALHVGNGAAFGAVYAAALAPRLPGSPAVRGAMIALAENFGLWPLGRVSDRFHPARRSLPRLTRNRRALWQATWRHLLFGVLLGAVEGRLNAAPEADPATSATPPLSSNGRGDLTRAAVTLQPNAP